MTPLPLARPLRAVLLGASAMALLAGCEAGQFGLSGRDAEWQRTGAFSVVSSSPERAVVAARGQRVAVEPPPGFCLAEDSIETSDRSAFVLVGDCVLENGAGTMPGAHGALDLPPGMPGIITVSISGGPGFAARGLGAEDLSDLESYLETPEGRALLGRGGDGSQVSVVDTRREGDILYVLVEDSAAQLVPLLATRFWRAFVELNGRLTVVTVSGFRDVPMDESEMLRHLGDQVRQLQLANAAPLEDAPIQVAEATPPGPAATGSKDEAPVKVETLETAPARTESAPAATGAGEPTATTVLPDTGPADEWALLAEAGAESLPEPTGASGGPEPIEGWAETAVHAEGVPAAWPTDDALARPVPRPTVTASVAAGTLGSWPMPLARPGRPASANPDRAGPWAAAQSNAPVPAPRVADPGASAAPVQADTVVPVPPRRVSR